jgi:hypothetical protein
MMLSPLQVPNHTGWHAILTSKQLYGFEARTAQRRFCKFFSVERSCGHGKSGSSEPDATSSRMTAILISTPPQAGRLRVEDNVTGTTFLIPGFRPGLFDFVES